MNPLLSWSPSNSNDTVDNDSNQRPVPAYSWGWVTQAQPLRVQLDTDTEPLNADLSTMDPNLAQGDRVMVQWQDTSAVVVGKSYRAGDSPTAQTGDPSDYTKIAEDKLEVARVELAAAQADFEAGNEERKTEIEQLNDVVIPQLEQDLATARQETQQALAQLDEGMATHADNIADARTRLSAAESTLAPLPGRIELAEQDVAAAQVEATKAAAAAVEANNRAMTRLANGNFESGLDYWSHSNVELTSTAHSGQQAAQVSGWLRPGSSFPVVPDQIWELSLYHQYDVTVTFETVDGDQRATLSTHHLDGDSTWSDSGALRATIPADVHMLSFTITGTSAIVDDITLRDVTDVVRLEEAANANRQKAEQAISELAVLQFAVDGEGGLKDRLASAETTLERKADEAVVDNVAAGLAGLSGLNTRTYIQDDEPPAPSGAVTYEWEGEPHASPSVKKIDGEIVARNESYGSPTTTSSINFDAPFDNSELNLITYTGSGTTYVGYASGFHRVNPGDYFAHAMSFDWDVGDIGRVRHQVQFRGPNNESISAPQIVGDKSDHPNGGRLAASYLVPEGTWEARVYAWFYLDGSFTTPTSGSKVRVGNFSAGSSETEQSALDQVATYFDGDSPAIPAETGLWVRGEDKFWFDQTTKQWVQIQDTGAFARLIANELFANLGVFDRLQAREGWIGGTLLADGAITAEKITATRELITKIMGAEWAYIAEQLVVDGELIAANIDAISAAIEQLTVTERADFAKAFAQEMWAELGVFDRIAAAEGIIGQVQLKDNAVGAAQINAQEVFTDEATANIVWAEIVRTGLLTAEEALIGGALIKEHEITVDKLTGLEEILTALLRAKKIEAGEIAGNAIDGMTVTGALLQTVPEAQRGVKINNNQLRVWDSLGRETVRIGDGVDNFLAGELYTNTPGEPGIILFPETSRGLPGIWFSEDGSASSSHPSIFVDSDWALNIRAKSGSTGTGSVRFHGSIEAVNSAILTSDGYGVYDGGTVAANRLEVYEHIYNSGHPTTGSSTNAYINPNSGLIARTTSARKYKTDIQKTDVPDALLDLDLSTWVDKNEKAELDDLSTRIGPLTKQDTTRLTELENDQRKIGMIADEVAEIDPRFVTYLDGEVDGLAYERLAVALFPVVRRQRDRITALEQQNADLEKRLARLEEKL